MAGGILNENPSGSTIPSKFHKFNKLPTQVAVDNQGNVRCDFPFDHLSLMKEIRLLKISTLNVNVVVEKPTTTEDDDASSPVFGERHKSDVTHVSETDTSKQGVADSTDGGEGGDALVPYNTTSGDEVGDGNADANGSVDQVVDSQLTSSENTVEVPDTTGSGNEDADGHLADDDLTQENDLTLTEGNQESNKTPNYDENEEPVDTSTQNTSPEDVDEAVDTSKQNTSPEDVDEAVDTSTQNKSPEDVEKDEAVDSSTQTTSPEDVDNDQPSGNSAQAQSTVVVVKGAHASQGQGGDKPIQLVVQSNISGVVRKITNRFKHYSKTLKNVKININSSPVVSLEKTTSVCAVSKQLDMKASVAGCENGNGNKKIKIYVDEELQMEKELMKIAKTPGLSKGSEIG